MEYRLRHRDGSWRWILARGQAVWDKDGRALRIVGSHSDITERKQSVAERLQDEERHHVLEGRYHKLFDGNPVPTWIYGTKDLLILDVNQAAIDHYGWPREEFLGLSVASIRMPGETQAIEAELRECSLQNRLTKPLRHRRHKRSEIWVELSSHDISAEGTSARLIMVNDVTARLNAEKEIKQAYFQMEVLVKQRTAELQLSEAKWRGLVEALPQFVWWTRLMDSAIISATNGLSTRECRCPTKSVQLGLMRCIRTIQVERRIVGTRQSSSPRATM